MLQIARHRRCEFLDPNVVVPMNARPWDNLSSPSGLAEVVRVELQVGTINIIDLVIVFVVADHDGCCVAPDA